MKILLSILLVISVPQSYSQDNLKIPRKWGRLPVGYLEDLKIENPSRKLNQDELRDLCRLFAKAYVTTRRAYRQDYILEPNSPVYRLFKTNFPSISASEEGGMHIIFLGDIFHYIWAIPEYHADMEQIIREGPFENDYCTSIDLSRH